jgi:glycosyltransferase involved in cell wall biosynthesis
MNSSYSVVIPAFNAGVTIREAIESVLEQTVMPAAILVVDDGSTDETSAAAAEMGELVHVIRKENGGPGSTTSAGLFAASTPIVATLDADDIWLPTKMEKQLAHLRADEDTAGVFALGRLFRDGEKPDHGGSGGITRLWTRTTMVYRTDAARAIGELKDFPGYLGELIDWLGRGRDLGHKHVMLEEVLALRRLSPGSLSDATGSDRTRGYLHAVQRAMERRKRTAPLLATRSDAK